MNKEIEHLRTSLSSLNSVDKWEVMKKELQSYIQKYTMKRGSERNLAISQLSEKIMEMENELHKLSGQDLQILENTRIDLGDLLQEKVAGVMFRAKVRWFHEGERNSKYFYNLERNKYNSKVCASLIQDDTTIHDPALILEAQRTFYQELYTSNEAVNFNLDLEIPTKVEENTVASDEIQFTIEEFANALKSMKNGSCPGCDGLSTEFYKVFWGKIKNEMYNAMIMSYENRLLPETSRTGILNLIPKGQKDTRYLKNIRPITLLNTDYKIVEKTIANRMVPALQGIIHEDQKGFLPNRRIAANIRKILDADQDGFILSCDFLKCFDCIEKSAVLGAMKKFGLSQTLIKWVDTIYYKFKAKVQNNGDFSGEIDVQCSVRQGGPASNALFFTVAELIAIMIREDMEIEGITLRSVLHLLNQYADDMDVCSKYKQKSLDKLLQNFQEFKNHTGFQLSYDKMTLYRLNSLTCSKAELYTTEGIKWTNTQLNILGVEIHTDTEKVLQANYDCIMDKVTGILKSWKNRNLSLVGKINIVNTLIASLFVYKMYVLPELSTKYINQLNDHMSKFIWNGHKPKVKASVLKKSKKNGGCGLVDFRRKDRALKCAWIKMLYEGSYPLTFVHEIINPVLGDYIWCSNLKQADVQLVTNIQNQFWEDVLKAWCDYHYVMEQTPSAQMIWWNSHIRIQNRPFFWAKPYERGLMFVHDLYREGSIIDQHTACQMYALTVMQYNSLVCAIPSVYKKYASSEEDKVFVDERFKNYMAASKCVKYVYDCLEEEDDHYASLEQRWEHECELGEEELLYYVTNIPKITGIAKYQSFQFRLMQRAIITNIQLRRWKIKDTDMCELCHNFPENYSHLFFECTEIQTILQVVERLCEELSPGVPVNISLAGVLTNTISEPLNSINNFIILCAKQYIYSKRCLQQQLSPVEFKRIVLLCRNTEKYYAIKNNCIPNYVKRWEPHNIETLKNICEQFEELTPEWL